MKKHLHVLIATCLFLTGITSAKAANGNEKPIFASGSPWYAANEANASLSGVNSPDSTQVNFTFFGPKTIRIQIRSSQNGKTDAGTVFLVGGKVMLVQGLSLKNGSEINAIDGPVLFYQLIVSLLTQAFPEGPDHFNGTHTINLHETKRGIKTVTTSASGYFPPPWTLKGRANRIDSENINFSLVFTFPTNGENETTVIKGTWIRAATPPRIDPDMKLSGWTAYSLGIVTFDRGGSTIFDYRATPMPTELKTLGQLQKSIRKKQANADTAPKPVH